MTLFEFVPGIEFRHMDDYERGEHLAYDDAPAYIHEDDGGIFTIVHDDDDTWIAKIECALGHMDTYSLHCDTPTEAADELFCGLRDVIRGEYPIDYWV